MMLQHIHVRHCKLILMYLVRSAVDWKPFFLYGQLRLLISVQFSLSDISVNDIVLVGYFTNEDLLAYTWRHIDSVTVKPETLLHLCYSDCHVQ